MAMTIRDHTRAYCGKSDLLGALSFLASFAVYAASLWLA